MKTRYDVYTRTVRQSRVKDEIMPTGKGRASASDYNFVNGAPFGPFDPNKPYWPVSKPKK